MGAWGYDWSSTDDAAEAVDNVISVLRKKWNRLLQKSRLSGKDYEQARAASVMAMRLQDVIDDSDLEDALKSYQYILDDESYIRTWDNPSMYRKKIQEEAAEIVRIMNNRRRRRASWKKTR